MRLTYSFSITAWGRLLLLLALALSAATVVSARPKPVAHHSRIFIPKMLPTIIPDARQGYQTVLRGRASWYGKSFQGMATASGERYDRRQFTCAHKKLPFGTRLRVTNVENGVTVVVRVSDRGPFRHERILDLSERAAQPLGLVNAGSATVIAVVVPETTPLGLADTPNNLATLRAGDPRPRAPFAAYLLPLLRQTDKVVAAVAAVPANSLASLPASTTGQLGVAMAHFEVQAGIFTDAQLAAVALARIQLIDPKLTGTIETTVLDGQLAKRVVINQLDSWLAAKIVCRNLQLWGIAGLIRPQLPSPNATPPVAGGEVIFAAVN